MEGLFWLTLSTGETFQFNPYANTFVGFTSNTPISSIQLRGGNGCYNCNSNYTSLDNLLFGQGNIAPTLTAFALNGSHSDITINEGQSVSAALSATDPGLYDDITFLVNGINKGTNYTDTTGSRNLNTSLGTFSDDGTVTYTATARDSDGANSNNSITRKMTVKNVGPTLTSFDLSSYEIFEGESITALLQAIDPGADAISFLLDGVNIGTDFDTSGTRSFSKDLGIFEDNGIFEFTGQAKDDDGGLSDILRRTLKVKNLAPTITNLSSNLVGNLLHFGAEATDRGLRDLLTFEWDLDGDGQYEYQGTNGQWSFGKGGSYTVGLRVSDGDDYAYSSFGVTVAEAKSVPEPTSVLGLVALGVLGVTSAVKRKQQQNS